MFEAVLQDEAWVTGVPDATTIGTAEPIIIKGKMTTAGKYAIFTIPGKAEWTVIINSTWQQHLAKEYDEKDDMVRFSVTSEPNTFTERLQYFAKATDNQSGTIAMAWEHVIISFSFTVKN